MRATDETGQFSAAIDQRVIDAALQSVERRGGTDEGDAAEPSAVEGAASSQAPAPVASAPATPPDETRAALEAQLEASLAHGRDLLAKLKTEHERHLRAAADLDNYKKRVQREREEQQRFGHERLLRDLLPVVDNFDRALEHARSTADFDTLRKGVEMIRRLFEDALAKHGARPFQAKGLPFDPSLHEAMSQAETADLPPNHVVSDFVRGFRLHDRLLRPALVVVSKAPAAGAPAQAAATAPAGASPEGSTGAAPAATPVASADARAGADVTAHAPSAAHAAEPNAPPAPADDSSPSR